MPIDTDFKFTEELYISDTQTKNHKKIDEKSDIHRYGGLLEFNLSDAALESFEICKNTKGQEYYRVEYKIFLSITDHLLSWEVVVPANSGTWKSFPAKDINVAAAFAPGS